MKTAVKNNIDAKSLEPFTEKFAKIAIDLPIPENESFYYLVPQELSSKLKTGMVVHVPFGKQEVNGYVIDIQNSQDTNFNVKHIYETIYEKPIWDKNYLELANWISKYYLTNIGTVLSASISLDLFDHYTHEVQLTGAIHESLLLTNEQKFIIDKFSKSKNQSLSYRFLLQKAKFSKQKFYQTINQLKNKGIITTSIKHKQKKESKSHKQDLCHNILAPKHPSNSQLVLNTHQQKAYEIILQSICNNKHKSFLIHGVTGSGKTEVYLKLINEVLNKEKTVIYLVPEIYLVPQVFQRLTNRFDPNEIIIWHSSLTKSERLINWEKLQNNKIKIILGARSAALAPIKNLGIIIIDEAHDGSYKQASPAPRYDAIKVALKRGEIENCPVILGTATPNITDYNHSIKDQTLLELPYRIENIPMPKVQIIDLTQEHLQSTKNIISSLLKKNISEALNKNEQIILLLNRRGYSSNVFCRACGFIQYCKNCSIPLVYHKNQDLMICHHCGYQATIARVCPECKSPHFKYIGVGTQQLEEEVKKIFNHAKVIRVDSDQLKRKDDYIKLWHDFSEHKADILIGTQLVAKGIDLPNVTVVGVILADSMFNFPDYVSYERAFQLLTQVAGRAGRGQKTGKVFIQTYQIDNPLFKFIVDHDYKSFYEKEIKQREQFLYPPFTTLSRIIFQSYDESECLKYAQEVLGELSAIEPQATFLGPAPCFFTKLHGKYRYHILSKIDTEENTNVIFNKLFQRLNKSAKVEVILDVDSVNLL